MLKKILLICSTFLIALSYGCAKEDKFVALIGDSFLKESDISFAVELEKTFGSDDVKRGTALAILINDALEVEIGKLVGVKVTGEELKNFSSDLDKNVENRDLSLKIKAVFGDDIESYNKLYLAPKLLKSKLNHAYKNDRSLYKTEQDKIVKAKSLIDKGSTLKEAADLSGAEYKKFKLSITYENKEVPMSEAIQKYVHVAEKSAAKNPMIDFVSKMKTGTVFKNILEDKSGFKIVKLIEKKKSGFLVETVSTKKTPIDEWFRDQIRFINLQIVDSSLKKSVIFLHPDLWWIKNLK